ncbi:hypothetical protein vseg_007176 [Gypsophila vaccaria]
MAGGGSSGGLYRFTVQLVTGRWFMVVATFLVMSVSGTGYLFGIYSPEIKSSLGYDQSTLNLLSFFKDLGSNVGVHTGVLLEFAPPWVVLIFGAVLNFFGYFMIWLAVTGRVAKPPVWLMFLYICIGANSTAFTNTAAIIPCVKNFPKSRGVVLGLLKGFVGLSGGIFTQLYLAFYGTNAKSLILLISWLPGLFSLVFLRVIRFMKHIDQKNESKVFFKFLYVSLGLATFLMVMTILQQRFSFGRVEYVLSGVGVVFVLFSMFFVAIREEYKVWESGRNELDRDRPNTNGVVRGGNSRVVLSPVVELAVPSENGHKELDRNGPDTNGVVRGGNNHVGSSTSGLATTFEMVAKGRVSDSCFQNVFRPPDRGEDYTVLQALFSIDLLILLVTAICGLGGALSAIDNFGQIGESLGYSKKSTRTCVSLISIWNYLGRVTSGFLSEHLLKKYKFPRPLMLTIILLLTCVGHLFIASGIQNGLYIASIIIGLCFGAQWPMVYAIISELFGLKYYSTLYNLGTIASPIGGYIFNVRVTGFLYDKEARKQLRAIGRVRKVGEELVCNGPKCFRVAFVIIACVTSFGMLTSIILVLRTRRFYHSDIYKKFREEEIENEMRNGGVLQEQEEKKLHKFLFETGKPS